MDELAREVAGRLEELMLWQTEFMIVERNATNYYVQFVATALGELYCEAVGNEYLEPGARIDDEQELALIGLGWSSPTPQFSQLWDEPIPFANVAERMARTLVEVFGAAGVADVTFTYGRSALATSGEAEPHARESC
jgi:hypothetical protein